MLARKALRPLVAAAAAFSLVAAGQAPASGAWSNSTVAGTFVLDRPSVVVDAADHTTIAYYRAGQGPGVFATTNGTGDWVSTRITSARDVRPSIGLDSADKAHIAFARTADTTGIYVTSNATGSWAVPSLVAADLDPRAPSLDVSPSDKLGVAWASSFSFSPGVYFATNATGSWVVTKIASGVWVTSPWLRYDASGHAHVMFGRIDSDARGLYHATNATGSWVVTKVLPLEVNGVQFAFDGAGKIQAGFRSWEHGTAAKLFYLTNESGDWFWDQLPSEVSTEFGPPGFAIDPAGELHIVAARYDSTTVAGRGQLFHYVSVGGNCCGGSSDIPVDDALRADEVPSLAFLSNGTMQLAFRRIYPTSGIRFLESGQTSSLVDGSELVNTGTAIDLGPGGTRHVAYANASGDGAAAMYATGTPGAWVLDEAGPANPARFATDIAADGSNKVRLVDGDGLFSNATGSWAQPTTLPFGSEAEVEVDANGHTHVIVAIPAFPYWSVDYRTDATGSWESDSPWPATSFDDNIQPSLALDANAKPHLAMVFPSDNGTADLIYQHRKTGAWSSYSLLHDGLNAWPSIAVDAAGKVHIAYIHYGASPGIYYATNKSGSWVRARLTRSYSEGAPSLALDGSGHVYIATTRNAFAANPGIYVMTNASGSWVVARVVSTDTAGNVSLAVTSTGLARLVYDSDVAIVVYENSSATLGASVPGATVTSSLPALDDAALGSILRQQLELGLGEAPLGPASSSQEPSAAAAEDGETTSVQINRFGTPPGAQ